MFLSQLAVSKATGLVDIPTKFLQLVANKFASSLTKMLNKLSFPDYLELHKLLQSLCKVISHVSKTLDLYIVSVLSKTLEKHVKNVDFPIRKI